MLSHRWLIVLSFTIGSVSLQGLTSSSSETSSTSIELNQQSTDIVTSARSYQRQHNIYNNNGNNGGNNQHNNKPFNMYNPQGCCSCTECCSCDSSSSDYPEIYDDPQLPSSSSSVPHSSGPLSPAAASSSSGSSSGPLSPLINRFGSTTRRSVIVRRRFIRPNGITVVEVEEQPNPPSPLPLPPPLPPPFSFSNRPGGSSIFGSSGLFSRFLPSALERNNSTRFRQVNNRNQMKTIAKVNLSGSNQRRQNQ